jgi:hypothetical protein
MTRFNLKTMLIALAVVALWLATFSWPDSDLTGPGSQIRKAMLQVILVASGVAAVCNHGRSRAFWSAFFATMLLLSVDVQSAYYRPDCLSIARSWSRSLSQSFNLNSDLRTKLHGGIWQGLVLGIATVAGLVAVWVYDQSRRAENE